MYYGVSRMETAVFWLKASGAALGSSIAIVFQPGGDGYLKLLQRFILGTILGFIAAPVLIDHFGWEHTPDYWLAASTLGGLSGYLLLQFLFSRDFLNRFKVKSRN